MPAWDTMAVVRRPRIVSSQADISISLLRWIPVSALVLQVSSDQLQFARALDIGGNPVIQD